MIKKKIIVQNARMANVTFKKKEKKIEEKVKYFKPV
jgi:hypothetical protein